MPSREVRAQRRAKAYGYDGEHFTNAEWESLLEACGHRCLRCRSSEEPLTVDHIVPLSLGGSNAIENIQPLCEECNGRKGLVVVDYRHSSLRGMTPYGEEGKTSRKLLEVVESDSLC